MLFESQAKADNFILYNKEEIEEENGKAPVRSYYCRLCGGWPSALELKRQAALKQAVNYVDAICQSDISRTRAYNKNSLHPVHL